MADMACLFCRTDRDAERIDGRAYICGICVQTLLSLLQDQLQEGQALAVEREYEEKAQAIESFLEVTPDESRNRHYTAKRFNGRRSVRTVRHEKTAARGFKKPERPSLYQIRLPDQAVL